MKKGLALGAVLLSTVLLSACTWSLQDSDKIEEGRVEDQQSVYIDSQPVPFFDWSLERHLMIKLYEARNDAVVTYSYARNLSGQIVFECQSMGFPLSADNQLTNPEREEDVYQGGIALPQAEPNGLFSGAMNRGTYVFCINDDGTVSPSYFEQDVEVHMAPIAGTRTVGEPSLKIKTSN